MRSAKAILLCTGLFLVASIPTPSSAAAWQGEETTVDGVLHVRNPAAPSQGERVVEVTELWRRGDEDDDIIFGVTGRILTDADGNSYILDRQLNEIQVFTEDGEWLRTMGGQGEGPGEFNNASDMFFTPGGNIGVSQQFPGKIVQMTTDGEPLSDYPMPVTEGFIGITRAALQGDGVVIAGSVSGFNDGKMSRDRFLVSQGVEGEESVEYYAENFDVDFAKLEFQELDLDGGGTHWTVGSDNRVFVPTEWNSYRIDVWNADGIKDRVIEREYSPTPRTQEQIDAVSRRFTININGREAEILTQENERCVRDIYPRPDGGIWVLTDLGNDACEDCIAEFDAYDAEGRFIERITLRGDADLDDDGFFVNGNYVYVVKDLAAASASLGGGAGEEEEEVDEIEADPLTVVCYRING
jgi:hypothetical protein